MEAGAFGPVFFQNHQDMKTIKFYGFRESVTLKMQLFDESGKLSSLSGLTEVNQTNTKKMTEYNIAPEQECNDEQHSKKLLALSSISQCFKSDNNHQL